MTQMTLDNALSANWKVEAAFRGFCFATDLYGRAYGPGAELRERPESTYVVVTTGDGASVAST